MAITKLGVQKFQYPTHTIHAEDLKAKVDEMIDALNTATTDGAGFLTADAAGRAVFEDDFFDAATIARVVDAKAVDTGSIADGAIEALQLATDAVETAKIKDDNVTQAKLAPVLFGAPSTRSGAGEVANTAPICLVTSTGVGQALTIADATLTGHMLRVVHAVDGGSAVVTQTTGAKLSAGVTTITLTNRFDWVDLCWTGTLWEIVGYSGATIA